MLVPTARPAQPAGWAEDRCIMEYLNIANLKKLLHAKQISLSQGLALSQPLDALSGGLCMHMRRCRDEPFTPSFTPLYAMMHSEPHKYCHIYHI